VTDQPSLPFDNRLGPSHHNAPETSGQAAVANMPRSGSQRAKVLLTIARIASNVDGLTDDEIAKYAGLVGNSVRPRRGELVRDGLLVDSGRRRSSWMGHPAVVWCLTDKGLRAAKELTDG
jgi:predicted ArsR family transcriptional regulator